MIVPEIAECYLKIRFNSNYYISNFFKYFLFESSQTVGSALKLR